MQKQSFSFTKQLIAVLSFFLLGTAAQAQFPAGTPGKGQQQSMNIGHLYGKITDSLGKPIKDVSVVLLRSTYDSVRKSRKDVLLKSITTTNSGAFSFEELPLFGQLQLTITAVGYKSFSQAVTFQPAAQPSGDQTPNVKANQQPAFGSPAGVADKDLGSIKLAENTETLQSVTVVSSQPSMKLDLDKKTFNVTKNIVSAGGTAVDVMRNVPSVQVDIDGNVKLRNATPQIYIDGRPTTLTLDQIPSDAIQTVEVITNPSAKYDASGGSAGILNIVLKKNKKSGYNGNLNAGVDSRGGFNGGGNFSVRQGKFNVSAMAMVNGMKNKATGTTDRYTYGSDTTHVYQQNTDKTTGQFLFGRLGLNYYVTSKTTLSIAGLKVHGEFKPNATITTDSLDKTNSIYRYDNRLTNGNRTFDGGSLQLGMVHNFTKEGEQLTADANYFGGKNTGNSLYTTNRYAGDNSYLGQSFQQQLTSGSNDFFTIQSDYTNPLSKKTKLEAGVRAQIKSTKNNNDTYTGTTLNSLVKLSNLTNNYKNTDQVYAAYTTISSSIKNFRYQIGLRAESSNYNGELTNTNQQFKNNYPISLFPSVFLSQKLNNNQELQLNFSRRVNRPNFFQLIPYTDFSDSLNITKGNPNLLPEFTNSFEMSYSKTFKGGNSLLVSAYYKHSTDLITRYLDTTVVNNQKILVNSYVNAQSSDMYGAEITSINNISKWWDVTTNVNIYNSKINTSNVPNATPQDAILSWFGKVNNNFKLPKNFTIQLSANYQSKTNLPVTQNQNTQGPPGMQAQSSSQGYIKPFWGVDLAIRKSFLKNQAASVSLSVSDIFRTMSTEQISSTPGIFTQDYSRLNNPQLVRLTFTYRFGKMDVSLFKRQNNKSSGMQDAMQMNQ